MKHTLLTCILLIMFGGCQAQQNSLESFDWLLGKWQRTNTKPGQTAFEIWNKSSETTFEGQGYTLKGADTVFVETLALTVVENKVVYTADVAHNPEKMPFEVKESDNSSFVCVNETHDFPNKIGYELVNNDSMKVFISDMSENNKRYFEFVRVE